MIPIPLVGCVVVLLALGLCGASSVDSMLIAPSSANLSQSTSQSRSLSSIVKNGTSSKSTSDPGPTISPGQLFQSGSIPSRTFVDTKPSSFQSSSPHNISLQESSPTGTNETSKGVSMVGSTGQSRSKTVKTTSLVHSAHWGAVHLMPSDLSSSHARYNYPSAPSRSIETNGSYETGLNSTRSPLLTSMQIIGTGAAGPTFAANQSLPPDFSTGVLSLSYGGMCTMLPGNDGKNAKSCSCLNSQGKWYHDHSRYVVRTTTCEFNNLPWEPDTDPDGCKVTRITRLAEPYSIPVSCCDRCKLIVQKVRLLYWPAEGANTTKRATNHEGYSTNFSSSGIVSGGITFVSPSVYVHYQNLYAMASCAGSGPINNGGWGAWSSIGGHYTDTIAAYRPEQLFTAKCLVDNAADRRVLRYCLTPGDPRASDQVCFTGSDLGWEAINFEELATPPPPSVIYERKKSCFPPDVGFHFETGDALRMFHSPTLSFPAEVTDIDPLWHSWANGRCVGDYLGAADPPKALPKATRLAAPTTEVYGSATQIGNPASPGKQPDSPTAVATPNPPATDHEPGSGDSSPGNKPDSPATVATPNTPAADHKPGVGDSSPGNKPNSPAIIAAPNPPAEDHKPSAGKSSPLESNAVETDPNQSVEQPPKPITLLPTDPKTLDPGARKSIAGYHSGNVDIPGDTSEDASVSDTVGYASKSAASAPDDTQDPSGEKHVPDEVVKDGQVPKDDPLSESSAIRTMPVLSDNGIIHKVNGGVKVGSQTLTPGSRATIFGHFIDYQNPTQIAVDKSQTYHLSSLSSAQPFALPVGGNQGAPQTVSRDSGGHVLIDGVTLSSGGSPATVSSRLYSLDVHGSSSSIIVRSGDSGETYVLPAPSNAFLVQALTTSASLSQEVVTIPNGARITHASGSGMGPAFVLPNGETVSAGGTAGTLTDGTVISALPGGKGLLINGRTTISLSPDGDSRAIPTATAATGSTEETGTVLKDAMAPGLPSGNAGERAEKVTTNVTRMSGTESTDPIFTGTAAAVTNTCLGWTMFMILILFLIG